MITISVCSIKGYAIDICVISKISNRHSGIISMHGNDTIKMRKLQNGVLLKN